MDDLYREIIIERYKTPHYRGHLDPHDIFFEDDNPTCGDHIEITIQVDDDGVVKSAAFDGHGCSISQITGDSMPYRACIGSLSLSSEVCTHYAICAPRFS